MQEWKSDGSTPRKGVFEAGEIRQPGGDWEPRGVVLWGTWGRRVVRSLWDRVPVRQEGPRGPGGGTLEFILTRVCGRPADNPYPWLEGFRQNRPLLRGIFDEKLLLFVRIFIKIDAWQEFIENLTLAERDFGEKFSNFEQNMFKKVTRGWIFA